MPMSSRVRALLEHHFALEKAFPVKTRRAQDIVKAVANRAEITKDVSPHVLRHTFATMALQKGISLPTVQKILGHDSLQTTAIYLNFTSTVGKTANSLVYPRRQRLTPLPCGGPARLDPSLEPRRSAVLISALATHEGVLGPFLAA